MGLYERLTGSESPRIPVHLFSGVLGEWERGKLSSAQAAAALGLSAGEQTEAATLLANIVPPREAVSIGSGPVTLTNVGTAFDGIAAALGLGSALVQTAGITEVIFGVRMDRNGSAGTISFQLFNETDASEVALITDTTGAGAKNLSTTVSFSPALGAGIKVCRVRCKSTTAADDPIYLGAAVSIRRVSSLTALELHEILLIASISGSIYNTVSTLKTRLGV